jgi:hypothetical protein
MFAEVLRWKLDPTLDLKADAFRENSAAIADAQNNFSVIAKSRRMLDEVSFMLRDFNGAELIRMQKSSACDLVF